MMSATASQWHRTGQGVGHQQSPEKRKLLNFHARRVCNSRSMLVELGCERVIGFKTLDLRATSASMACMRHERASAKATAGLHLRLPHWPCGHMDMERQECALASAIVRVDK